jgi:hypothetical protein
MMPATGKAGEAPRMPASSVASMIAITPRAGFSLNGAAKMIG